MCQRARNQGSRFTYKAVNLIGRTIDTNSGQFIDEKAEEDEGRDEGIEPIAVEPVALVPLALVPALVLALVLAPAPPAVALALMHSAPYAPYAPSALNAP